MSMRKYFFWIHLTAGGLAGLVILTMCVTGVLLSVEKQITNWAERDVRRVNPLADAPRLPMGTLLALALRGGRCASNGSLAFRPKLDCGARIRAGWHGIRKPLQR